MATQLVLKAKQSRIFNAGWTLEARFRVAVCGRRFGKSYTGVAEVIRAAKFAKDRNIPVDQEIWIAGPTFKQMKRVWWNRLKAYFPKKLMLKKNENEATITLKSGHVVRIVGLEPSAMDNLRGSGLFFVVVDEFADCAPEAWEEIIRPMLSTSGGHALFIGTPKGKANILYEFYRRGLDGEHGFMSFHFTSTDGGYVPPEELEAIKAENDPRTFEQEYLARFVTYSGIVFYAFDRDVHVRPGRYTEDKDLLVGMDFNYNPMSAVISQEVAPGVLHQIDEILIPTSNTDEMVDEIKSRYQNHRAKIIVFPDPAARQNKTSAGGKTDLSILREHFEVVVLPSHPKVRDRINTTNSRFRSADGQVRYYIDPKCKETIKCCEQYQYKDGTVQPDKASGLDHVPDAMGYKLYTLFGRPGAKSMNVSIFGR